ncbi:hypothetical protein PAHAL_4G157200 [Panicum hallii]|uniref:Uncharacterized protein n=1 Tax=Panicum hallii TaxID=206008 RepID=A0A2T8JD07_9POAL|nr:hypothetical protein PAHAL_4G157200 [Panicum hallii]
MIIKNKYGQDATNVGDEGGFRACLVPLSRGSNQLQLWLCMDSRPNRLVHLPGQLQLHVLLMLDGAEAAEAEEEEGEPQASVRRRGCCSMSREEAAWGRRGAARGAAPVRGGLGAREGSREESRALVKTCTTCCASVRKRCGAREGPPRREIRRPR